MHARALSDRIMRKRVYTVAELCVDVCLIPCLAAPVSLPLRARMCLSVCACVGGGGACVHDTRACVHAHVCVFVCVRVCRRVEPFDERVILHTPALDESKDPLGTSWSYSIAGRAVPQAAGLQVSVGPYVHAPRARV